MKKGLKSLLSIIKFAVSLIIAAVVMCVSPKNVLALTKRIEIDLTHQHLYAYEDNTLKYDFLVSTGKLYAPTPTGTFSPGVKLRYDRMIGGSKANGTYYNLPNVPYVVYIYNRNHPLSMGYAIHGTYWHNNFGHPMSHGCINLRTTDMEKLYPWIDMAPTGSTGTTSSTVITIYGNTP